MTARAATDGAFARYWASDACSVLGAEITLLALPLVALLALHASPLQMGVLVACELLPFGLFSLHAGAWIDRTPKLPPLRIAALTRAALVLSVPAAAALDVLRFEWIAAVAFLLSTHAVFVDLAYQSLLPTLVPPAAIVRANARLATTQSAAGIAGPGLAGLLAQGLGAPFALIVDAAGLLVAGLLLRGLRADEPAVVPSISAPARVAIADGLRRVFVDPALRWPMLAQGAWQLLKNVYIAAFLVFAAREAGLSAAGIGVVSALAGVGFCLSALSSPWLARRVGLGPTLLVGLALVALCWSAAPLARGALAGPWLGVVTLLEGVGAGWFCLAIVNLRQMLVPVSSLARVIASYRFVTLAAAPIGALLGGVLADTFGARAALALAGGGAIVTTLVLVWGSPLARLRVGGAAQTSS